MRSNFVRHLRNRIETRWHMSLICLFTLGGGILVSKMLLWLHLPHPALRYGIAAIAGYLLFFIAIATWVRLTFGRIARGPRDASSLDHLSSIDLPVGFPRARAPAPDWRGGGGGFSGAGASEPWGEDSLPSGAPSASAFVTEGARSAGDASGSGVDLDLGDADGSGVIIVAVVTVAVILGGAFYVIYLGPEILLEAAFETLLVAGVFQRARHVPAEGWAKVVLKRTWWAFGLVLVMVLALGQVIRVNCPEAKSLEDFRYRCSTKK